MQNMMKFVSALAGALALAGSPALAFDDPARPESMQAVRVADYGRIVQPLRPSARERRGGASRVAPAGLVHQMISSEVCARIGCEWTATALRIARIESGYRCNARNGRAVGIFQNTNPAMFGVSRGEALTCSGGVRAGVAHMAMCLDKGARTASQMMVCHNAGTPFARRVERAYRIALQGG